MKKSIILPALAVIALGLAGCGKKADENAYNAELELNETIAPVENETIEANKAEPEEANESEKTAQAAEEAADAAKDAAEAAAAAAANHSN